MGFGAEQLRDKALLALEEAVVECRYGRPRRTLALRFAFAYLWACCGKERQPFDDLWRAMGQEHSPWSHGVADVALTAVYGTLGVRRDDDAAMTLWKRRYSERNPNPTATAKRTDGKTPPT